MERIKPVEYLNQHKSAIKPEYLKFENNSPDNFDSFMQNLISTSKSLLKNLDKNEIIEELLVEQCENYFADTRWLFRRWLLNAFDNEILHLYIVSSITDQNFKDKEIVQDNKYYLGSDIIQYRNDELFKKKFGLQKRDLYVEKRKFLEECADNYLEKYTLCLNDISSQMSKTNNSVFTGLTDMEFYQELYDVTTKEMKLLDKKEETRLFEENNFSYFISEDILAQLFRILTEDRYVPDSDKDTLWRLLRFGSTLSKKIPIDLTISQLAHSFYQLAKNKLISKSELIELSEWLFTSFEPKTRFGEDYIFSPDTIRRYISKRKKIESGEEVFRIVKLKRTKTGPKYSLEELFDG